MTYYSPGDHFNLYILPHAYTLTQIPYYHYNIHFTIVTIHLMMLDWFCSVYYLFHHYIPCIPSVGSHICIVLKAISVR